MTILAIESSCDEFSIAIIQDGEILTNVISSQIEQHKKFNGVVPELAARLHVENFYYVFQQAIKEAGIQLIQIDQIAYTQKPGLVGSLIVGKIVAETIGLYLNKPVVGYHHIEGHIYGALINHDFTYPILAMVVSGGHTQIQLVKSANEFEIIGQTLDDAIGECYDKVARVLGLEYPGGPIIDKLAQSGNMDAYKLPLAKNDDSYDFSFSGIKTACINLIHNLEQKNEKVNLENFCASFQKTVSEIIRIKLEKALQNFDVKTLTVGGGVSANSAIRKIINELGQKYKIENYFVPKMQYCTDNAAMIANLAYFKYMERKD